jgi:large subunit ribosomal protein L21e
MGRRSRGFRNKTREKLKQPAGYRPAITKFLQEFKTGQTVIILPEPSSHKGQPHSRYKGRVGTITGKIGRSYIIEVKDGSTIKKIIARPEHIRVAK